MTNEERDDLLRWAAEDVMRWTPAWPLVEGRCQVCADDARQRETSAFRKEPWPFAVCPVHWQDEAGEFYGPSDLTGWPGFGLAVAAAQRRAWDWRRTERFFELWEFDPDPLEHVLSGRAPWDPDYPAESAWMAVKVATGVALSL